VLLGGVGSPAQYGPRSGTLVVYLIAYHHLPYDRAARLLTDWLAAPLSAGTLHTFVKDVGEGLDEFTALVLEQPYRARSCRSIRPAGGLRDDCGGCTPTR
jgi:hypothetical protein